MKLPQKLVLSAIAVFCLINSVCAVSKTVRFSVADSSDVNEVEIYFLEGRTFNATLETSSGNLVGHYDISPSGTFYTISGLTPFSAVVGGVEWSSGQWELNHVSWENYENGWAYLTGFQWTWRPGAPVVTTSGSASIMWQLPAGNYKLIIDSNSPTLETSVNHY